jgi:hypothetical protein
VRIQFRPHVRIDADIFHQESLVPDVTEPNVVRACAKILNLVEPVGVGRRALLRSDDENSDAWKFFVRLLAFDGAFERAVGAGKSLPHSEKKKENHGFHRFARMQFKTNPWQSV